MRPEDAPKTSARIHRLADYRPPAWLVERTRLTFRLDPKATRVTARIVFRRNPAAPADDLHLDGHSMALVSAAVDGG